MADYTEALHEWEWRRCAPDWDSSTPEERAEAFEYFCRKYWYIRHPTAKRGRMLFDLYPEQSEVVRCWISNRYTVALKARQIGFSTLVSTYCFWLTFFYESRNIIMVSKTERHSKKLLLHSKYGYRFLPDWMKLRGPMRVESTQGKTSWSNESAVESLPSASEPGRGDTVFLGVVDEIGFLPNSEDAYAALEPIAEVGGSLIMLGTANGEGNLFHKLWLGSQGITDEYSQYEGIFAGYWAAGRDEEWYKAKAKVTPEHVMAQEYPRNPEEAFLKSGRMVFDLEALQEMEEAAGDPLARGVLLADRKNNLVFSPIEEGALKVWEKPKTGTVYVIGADVAEGFEHGDFSSAHVIDVKKQRVVAAWHGHIDADLFGEDVLDKLGRWYNTALVGVESNNHGLTTLKFLQRAKYKNIFRQHRLGGRREAKLELLGWRTTSASKPWVIDELGASIRELSISCPDKPTLAELKTFTRDEKGRMSGSPFDDRTMSLAIAFQMVKYAYLEEFKVDQKPGPGTIGWLIEHLNPKPSETRTPIGAFGVRSGGRGTASLL